MIKLHLLIVFVYQINNQQDEEWFKEPIELPDMNTDKENQAQHNKYYSQVDGTFEQFDKTNLNSIYFIAGSTDSTILMQDMKTGSIVHRLLGHEYSVYSVKVSPSNFTALSASSDNSIILWDLFTGTINSTIRITDSNVKAIAFTKNENVIVSGLANGKIIVWQISEYPLQLQSQVRHIGPVLTLSTSAKYLVSGGGDGKVIVFKCDFTISHNHTLDGHNNMAVVKVIISNYEEQAASLGEDGLIVIWDLFQGTKVLEINKIRLHRVKDIQFSFDDKYIVMVGLDKNIIFWDLNTNFKYRQIETDYEMTSLEVSKDSYDLIIGSTEGNVQQFEIRSKKWTISNKQIGIQGIITSISGFKKVE